MALTVGQYWRTGFPRAFIGRWFGRFLRIEAARTWRFLDQSTKECDKISSGNINCVYSDNLGIFFLDKAWIALAVSADPHRDSRDRSYKLPVYFYLVRLAALLYIILRASPAVENTRLATVAWLMVAARFVFTKGSIPGSTMGLDGGLLSGAFSRQEISSARTTVSSPTSTARYANAGHYAKIPDATQYAKEAASGYSPKWN